MLLSLSIALSCAIPALAARAGPVRANHWPAASAAALAKLQRAPAVDIKSPLLRALIGKNATEKLPRAHLALLAAALEKRETEGLKNFARLAPEELAARMSPAAEAAGEEAERQALKVLNRFGASEIAPAGLADEAERVLIENAPYLRKATLEKLAAARAVMLAAPMKLRLETENERWAGKESAPPWETSRRAPSAGSSDSNPFAPENYRHPLTDILNKHAPGLAYAAESGDPHSFNWSAEAAFTELENGIKPTLKSIRAIGDLGPWQLQQLEEARSQAHALQDFMRRVWTKHGMRGDLRWQRLYEGLRDRINRVQTRIRSEQRLAREKALKAFAALEALREESDGRAVAAMLEIQDYYRTRLDRAWRVQYPEHFAKVNDEITRGEGGLPPIRAFHAMAHYILSQDGNWRHYERRAMAGVTLYTLGLFFASLLLFRVPSAGAASLAAAGWGLFILIKTYFQRLRPMQALKFELSVLRRLRRPPGP